METVSEARGLREWMVCNILGHSSVGLEDEQLIRGLVASLRSWKCILQALMGFQKEMKWCFRKKIVEWLRGSEMRNWVAAERGSHRTGIEQGDAGLVLAGCGRGPGTMEVVRECRHDCLRWK